jgi:hypothetical protein
VLELWRQAEAVPSVSDDPAGLAGLLETSGDALLVAEGRLSVGRYVRTLPQPPDPPTLRPGGAR